MAYTFSNVITTDNAKADGKDTNSISFTLLNGNTYAGGISLKAYLSGEAIFTNNGASELELITDVLGNAKAAFTDLTAEIVTVIIVMDKNKDVNAESTVNFLSTGESVKSIFLLLQENDAKADGVEKNVVAVQAFDGDNAPVVSVQIGLSLSNDAAFVDGTNKTTITTSDDDGTAAVALTNKNTGTTRITAYLPENLTISNEVDTNFKEVIPVLSTTLAVISNDAIANGSSFNQIVATVINKNTGEPESGASVNFSISNGDSTFIDGATTFTNTSDADGKVYARLISTSPGSSNVVAQTYTGASNSVYVDFTEDYSELEIIRIFNTLKSFGEEGPTTAWPDATFYVEAAGGSGDYTWGVNDDSAISFESQNHQTGTFVFTSNTEANVTYTISVTDNVTNLKTSHSFTLHVFFSTFGNWSAYNILHKNKYPSLANLTSLYDQWGDMSKYPGWLISGGYHYWTNTEELGFSQAVNLKTGKIDALYILLTLCGVATLK